MPEERSATGSLSTAFLAHLHDHAQNLRDNHPRSSRRPWWLGGPGKPSYEAKHQGPGIPLLTQIRTPQFWAVAVVHLIAVLSMVTLVVLV